MSALRIPRVDALNLATMLARFWPEVEGLLPADKTKIRQQLADHMVDSLGLNAETAERFDAIVTSPFYAERVAAGARRYPS